MTSAAKSCSSAQTLQPGVARADEDVGQVLAAGVAVLQRLGDLEGADHVVAHRDRLGQRLQRHAVLGEPGDRQRAADRADRHHELVVAQFLPRAVQRAHVQDVALR